MKALFFYFLLTILPFLSYSQEFGLGSIDLDDSEAEKIPLIDTSETKGFILPMQKRVLNEFFTPGDQDKLCSCAGWALRHLVMLQMVIEGKPLTDLSASFIYNLLLENEDSCKGVKISDGLRLLKTVGISSTSTFPNLKDDCKRIFPSKSDSLWKVTMAKYCLVYDHPVVISMQITYDFEDYRCDETWHPTGEVIPKWGHALVMIGYKDNPNKSDEGYFELMNSYGKKCGNKGIVKITYKDYAKLAVSGYAITF